MLSEKTVKDHVSSVLSKLQLADRTQAAVFAWRGMGRLFVEGLQQVDPNPVMGFFIVTSVAFVIFNMLADIAYAYLDPRIRIS